MSPAVAAFKAARRIPWGAKAVWVEDWILDRGPEASWISGSNLAARLGVSRETVERHRRALAALGFYHVVKRVGCRTNGWVPTLPLGCRHHGTSLESIQATAARIDAIVGGKLSSIEDGVRGAARDGVRDAAATGVKGAAIDGVTGAATHGVSRAPLIQNLSAGQALVLPEDRARVSAYAPKPKQEGRLAAERSTPDFPEEFPEPIPRAIDQRPADEVTNEGFERIRQQRRDAALALASEDRQRKAQRA